ncbi:MAG TPA: hypothetical protein VHW44_10155 [Pseudonocardiaceae bacterium]|nr:hypothetical protein [Pseudonocardiaceae bacterium]
MTRAPLPTDPSRPAVRPDPDGDRRWNRRSVLRVGGLTALAVPVVGALAAGCTTKVTPPAPDELLPLLASAKKDSADATAAATAFPSDAPTFSVVAAVRSTHASALAKEITRAGGTVPGSAGPSATTTAPQAPASSEADAYSALQASLRAAQRQAAALVPTVPTYRAGLLGSVSAGCASVVEALGG